MLAKTGLSPFPFPENYVMPPQELKNLKIMQAYDKFQQ